MSPVLPFFQAFTRLPLCAKINLIALAAALTAFSIRLWPEWRSNPDLSHGLFMPVVFLLLLHESRSTGAARYLPRAGWVYALFSALLVAALAALSAAGLYAAAVGWSHALVNFVLTASLVFLLASALVAYSSARVRFIGFNWSAVAAVALWMLCAPIPPGTYTRLTINLQLLVSETVLQSLHLLGVAAIRQGNIIKLAHATVGVEEACSGVRSLISCVFAGVFFSATLVRRPWARALIIGLSAPLALVMNFVRSLTLTLLANNGIDISGTWHDATGFAVLGVTAALLGGLAVLLERGAKPDPPAPEATTSVAGRPGMQHALTVGVVLAAGLIALFTVNTRPSVRRDLPAPDLLALLPASAEGWQATTTDLYEFRGTLHTEHLAQRRYARAGPDGPVEVTIYVAYWRPGQAPVSLVASHTPDACWPGAGWTQLGTSEPRTVLTAGDRQLFPAEHRVFKAGEHPQHVWFWHLYDGSPISYRDPYSATELLRIALRFGFRHEGDQLFVRLSSNRAWKEIAGEPLIVDFFRRTATLGL
ncbi:MAG: exosortase/archaeosortase family protein [Opitutaceae bacterium]|nr:exosortase/archaeosortase family protein [Opitutaceae bacterium]